MPTIALVDDDRNILTSLSIALETQGYRINTYTDGFAALDGFRTEPPDLAIPAVFHGIDRIDRAARRQPTRNWSSRSIAGRRLWRPSRASVANLC